MRNTAAESVTVRPEDGITVVASLRGQRKKEKAGKPNPARTIQMYPISRDLSSPHNTNYISQIHRPAIQLFNRCRDIDLYISIPLFILSNKKPLSAN